jgi:NADPH:quinone reductase-like Zn-dependent oxidoreductase
MDVAGVVSGLGPGAGWQVGDEVVALVLPTEQHGGAYAEQVVVPGESVARRPRGASMAEAATLPMNGLSAWLALEALALPAGRSIAVSGAAGALGGFVVQLAKAAGLRVIADAAAADEELVRALGADHVLARGNDFATHVRALEPGGVDGAVDAALLNEHIFPAVRDGGALVVVRGRGGNPGRGIRVEPVWVSAAARNSAALARLVTHAEQGIVALRVARVLPAHAAAKAHALLEAGGIRGRLVLEFGRS